MVTFYASDQVCFKLNARDLLNATINLTGSTVKLRYKAGTAAAVEVTATITDPTGGKAEAWVIIPTTAGDFWWEWTITDSGAHPATGPQTRRFGTIVAKLV